MQYTAVKKRNPFDDSVKWYAQAAPAAPVESEKIAREISDTNTVTDADIAAVLKSLQRVIANHLADGQSVRLGDLGSFRATITSEGQATEKAVTANTIKGVRVRFTPGAWLKKQLSVKAGAVSFAKASGSTESGTQPEA